ncbi:MAG: TrmH family RNA methyltransferase [Candidatus Dojkabacteria bacterium]
MLTIVLDNIRSAFNVGSVLRTAECAGAAEVITTGYTPNAQHPKVIKTALGAEEIVNSRTFKTLQEAIDNLSKEGNSIYGIEISENSTSLWEKSLPEIPTAIIFGNEIDGVQEVVLFRNGIEMLHIPQFGEKESLNVANASAIAIYDITKRWRTN